MSEVKKGNGLVYKNHPLRRVDNLIFSASDIDMADTMCYNLVTF